MKIISAAFVALALACDPPPPQGPQQLTYENGYAQPSSQQQGYGAQTGYQNPPVTYTPTANSPQQPMQMIQVQPPPAATATATATATTATPDAPVQMQVTPVPLGVQALPPPTATTTATATPVPVSGAPTANKSTMAVPGPGAFQCTSDAQCLLGRCNTQYGRCAYPCKSTENDCKAGNVCTAAGLCMPKGAAGVKM